MGWLKQGRKDERIFEVKKFKSNKVLTVLITLALILALVGCGGNKAVTGDSDATQPAVTDIPEDSVTETGTDAEAGAEAEGSEEPEIVPGKRADRVINPSELIGEEDAIQIFGEETKLYDQDTPYGLSQSSLMCRYGSYDGTTELEFIIGITQDATLREDQSLDQDMIDSGGVTGYNQRTGKAFADAGETPLAGIGEWAFIADNSHGNGKNVAFAYEAYNVTMALKIFQDSDNDEVKAWMTEKLTEAGELAADRLAAIVG